MQLRSLLFVPTLTYSRWLFALPTLDPLSLFAKVLACRLLFFLVDLLYAVKNHFNGMSGDHWPVFLCEQEFQSLFSLLLCSSLLLPCALGDDVHH